MSDILVIDDEAPMRNLIRAILEQLGHTVVEASNGREGLSQYDRHQPSLVICDIFMPVMEGLETIRILKDKNAQCPILAISGGGDKGQVGFLKMAEKIGADRVTEKPISHAFLAATVTELLA